jgi:hypothetical protein
VREEKRDVVLRREGERERIMFYEKEKWGEQMQSKVQVSHPY